MWPWSEEKMYEICFWRKERIWKDIWKMWKISELSLMENSCGTY
jgi:hypothetical protein